MIAILTWGTWPEREIAIKSAQNFCDNISYKYDYFLLPDQIDSFLSSYKKYQIVIPVFHWEYWEDGKIFGLLESLGIDYTFSNYETHVIWMNKFLTNKLVENLDILIPESSLLTNTEQVKNINFDFPLIIKPNNWWSSVWISIIKNQQQLEEKAEYIFDKLNDNVLVQELIEWEEYSVSVVGSKNPEILPIMKLDLSNSDFFDYNEKYNSDGSNEVFGKEDKTTNQKLSKITKEIYKYFNCSWFARIDYIVNSRWIYFLEINTIPWFTEKSILSKSRELTWRKISDLIDILINLGKK